MRLQRGRPFCLTKMVTLTLLVLFVCFGARARSEVGAKHCEWKVPVQRPFWEAYDASFRYCSHPGYVNLHRFSSTVTTTIFLHPTLKPRA